MKIQEILNEVLASPYPYNIQPAGVDLITATFEAGTGMGYFYRMSLSAEFLGDDRVVVKGDVAFADETGEEAITGKGDAFRVIATVIDITRKLVNATTIIRNFLISELDEDVFDDMEENGLIPDRIEMLQFKADPEEPSRVKLYRRIAKSIPGYTVNENPAGNFVLVSNTVK